ncbi:hypothetical protein [uncultured Clostridium sp.]|uniref:hypothetical protein n=1 Tax=uncultured Clostridium sp. TaxID=59620 RepID=UPI002610FFD0|nr:hypothetical protein [uncultured Clostridium sp.]
MIVCPIINKDIYGRMGINSDISEGCVKETMYYLEIYLMWKIGKKFVIGVNIIIIKVYLLKSII